MHRTKKIFALVAVLSLVTVSALAQSGDKANVKGMITTRTGDTLSVKSDQGSVTVVVLTDNTKTKDNKGLLGVRNEKMASVVLMPGLKVDVAGTQDGQGRVVASVITVDGDDLETTQMIQAGLTPTKKQVASNTERIEALERRLAALEGKPETNQSAAPEVTESTKRFTALSDFEVKTETTVNFGSGSSSISAEGAGKIKTLAKTATDLPDYLVEVTGYADSTGDAAINTKLSEDRAKAVITYLMQKCAMPVRRIVAPGAMGEYAPVASNETQSGRAENRRVEVKVLVGKTSAGN